MIHTLNPVMKFLAEMILLNMGRILLSRGRRKPDIGVRN